MSISLEERRRRNRDYMREQYRTDPVKRAQCQASIKRYAAANRDKIALANWARHLKRRFGITAAEYMALLNAQKGVCALCEKPPKKIRLAVDHNHHNGKVRGLLCMGCNMALGILEKRLGLTPKLYFYLERGQNLRRAA